MIITASADMSAKLFDVKTFEVTKTFTSDHPLNGTSISSSRIT
jgi:hypothetical protein